MRGDSDPLWEVNMRFWYPEEVWSSVPLSPLKLTQKQWCSKREGSAFKGIVQPENKVLSSFTHSHVFPNLSCLSRTTQEAVLQDACDAFFHITNEWAIMLKQNIKHPIKNTFIMYYIPSHLKLYDISEYVRSNFWSLCTELLSWKSCLKGSSDAKFTFQVVWT